MIEGEVNSYLGHFSLNMDKIFYIIIKVNENSYFEIRDSRNFLFIIF